MSARNEYAQLMGQINNTGLFGELDEIAGVYEAQATNLEEALGQMGVVRENLSTEHSRGAQALSHVEAASSTMHSPDIMQPAHTDMATAAGQLAAARHVVNQSQERLTQAMNTITQEEQTVPRSQQECVRHAASLRDTLGKLQMLGALAAEAKALANPDAQ